MSTSSDSRYEAYCVDPVRISVVVELSGVGFTGAGCVDPVRYIRSSRTLALRCYYCV